MIVTFPYKYVSKNHFGQLYRPYAKILVRNVVNLELWLERIVIVDPGADFTLFPRKDAYLFGVDIARDTYIDRTFELVVRKEFFSIKV